MKISGTTFASVILILLAVLISFQDPALGHAPAEIELEYDYDDQTLSATFTHGGGPGHYIETVIVYRNDVKILEETYTDQPETRVFTYEYEITAVDNDVLKVWAECSLGGSDEAEITVVGPRDYMILTVNPEPESVESGEDLDMTVNIFMEDETTPLDGVQVIADAYLGFIGDVSDLGLGGYGFTYSAPNLDTEDIEVINLSCTKNGYHPLYYEFSFDLVLASDNSRDIKISLSPVFFQMDEGKKKTLEVEVKAGGSYLDVGDIDVDYSHGKLTVQEGNEGRYTLQYTADQVDSDTTAFIRITASKTGYVEGSKEIQFRIKDTGDQEGSTEVGDDLDYNTILAVVIAALILVIIVIAFLRFRKRNRPEEVQVVQAEEIIDERYDQ